MHRTPRLCSGFILDVIGAASVICGVNLPMDRLWGKFLHVIFICVMSPVMHAGLSIAAKLARARPVRVGKVTICGPQGFRDLCGALLARLASLDPMMYRRLTGVHRVWVFYDDRRQGAQLFRELRCLTQTDDISHTTSRARIVCISKTNRATTPTIKPSSAFMGFWSQAGTSRNFPHGYKATRFPAILAWRATRAAPAAAPSTSPNRPPRAKLSGLLGRLAWREGSARSTISTWKEPELLWF